MTTTNGERSALEQLQALKSIYGQSLGAHYASAVITGGSSALPIGPGKELVVLKVSTESVEDIKTIAAAFSQRNNDKPS